MEVGGRIDEADAELVGELYAELRRFAAVVVPYDFDPDDVLHATLVTVLRRRRLAGLDDAGAYLRRAIVNHVRSEFRRSRTRRRTLDRLRATSIDAVDVYPSDVAELMRLRPVERAVLFLHDIEGRPFNEVSNMVGITASNARVAASRARRRLRVAIREGSR